MKALRTNVNLTISWFLRYCHTQLYNNSAKRGFFESKDKFPFKEAYRKEILSKRLKYFASIDTLGDFGLNEMLIKEIML